MKTPISRHDILFPEKVLLSSIKDVSEGKLGNGSNFVYRAVVIEIDHVGGKLEETPKKNPKNSIRARIISSSVHAFLQNEDLPVFWPLFSHDVMPVKPNEHVYVIFDGEKMDHGVWLARIPEPYETDDKNYVPGIKKYQLDASGISEQQVQDLENPPPDIQISQEFQQESVPKFTARIGDRVIEGSNNALIVLGRDRITDVDSGQNENAGTIDLVVGRQNQENLDLDKDYSRVYISMNTDVDSNFKTDQVGSSSSGVAAIALKSDEIRIVARKGMKIVVEGGDVTIEANTINLGKDAQEAAVLGNKLVTELGKICDAIINAAPGIGQLGQVPVILNPLVGQQLTLIKQLLEQNILSKKNKVK